VHAARHKHKQEAEPIFKNSVLAEQQNAPLEKLKKGAAHMRQDTLLWVVRVVLYLQCLRQGQPELTRHYVR